MGMEFEPYYKLKIVDLSTTDTVASSGGIDTVALQPDAGYIYEVVSIEMLIPDPAGSSAGTHYIEISNGGFTNAQAYAILSSNTGTDIKINNTGFVATSEQPTGSDQHALMHNWMCASNSRSLNFKYTNNTDVNQTGDRRIEVFVKEFKEAV